MSQHHYGTLGVSQPGVQSSSICFAMIGIVGGPHDRPCRDEYFICAHIYARAGILTHVLSIRADDRRAAFSIVLVGNQIDSGRLIAAFVVWVAVRRSVLSALRAVVALGWLRPVSPER